MTAPDSAAPANRAARRNPKSLGISGPSARASEENAWHQVGDKSGRRSIAWLRSKLALIAAQLGPLFQDIDIEVNANWLATAISARGAARPAIACPQPDGHRDQAAWLRRMTQQRVDFEVVPELLPVADRAHETVAAAGAEIFRLRRLI